MILRALLVLALLIVAGYGVWEIRRWQTPVGALISPRQRRLRAWGLFFSLLTLGLWLSGVGLPTPQKKAVTRAEREAALRYIGYWTVTALAALPLIPLALLDSRENLQRYKDERRRIFQETLGQTDEATPDPTDEETTNHSLK